MSKPLSQDVDATSGPMNLSLFIGMIVMYLFFRIGRLVGAVKEHHDDAAVDEDSFVESRAPSMGDNNKKQKSRSVNALQTDANAIKAPMISINDSSSFVRAFTMKPPGTRLEDGDFICRPINEGSSNAKSYSFRCSCENGLLPPGILSKHFGSAQAAFNLGTGKCYHKQQ